MSVESRMQSLKGRHATLEARIADEDLRPRPDDIMLGKLKREKLRLKEELDRLGSRTSGAASMQLLR